MSFSIDDLLETDDLSGNDVTGSIGHRVTESTLVPPVGNYLGLDISETSSGVCLYRDGIKSLYNITLNLPENSEFREVIARRQLKEYLTNLFGGESFQCIVIEDVYQGDNPSVTRLLYGLNTAIDEMVLDKVITCETFVRTNNRSWKSWLWAIDTEGVYKGFNDKEKVEGCLKLLGVSDEGQGYQDRLDATGMLLGYFLATQGGVEVATVKKKSVSFSDVQVVFETDMSYIHADYPFIEKEGATVRRLSKVKFTKKLITKLLTDSPDTVYFSKDLVVLGNIAKELGLGYISGGGYLGFWVKKNRLKRYRKD